MNDFCTQSCTTRIKNIEMKSFETSRKLVWCWAQALHIKDYKISELEWRMFSWYFCLVGQICWPIRARYKMISRGRGCSEFFLGNQSANNLQTCAPWYISRIKYFIKLQGVPKKRKQRFNLNFLSYYRVNHHIQPHFWNPQDLSFPKHPRLLSLDQPKAEKIKENHKEPRKNFLQMIHNTPQVLYKNSLCSSFFLT